MADSDGRRQLEVFPGGGEGPVEDRATKLRRFKGQLRDEIYRRLDPASSDDQLIRVRVPDLTAGGLCEEVIRLRDRSHREAIELMKPGFGR